MCGSADTEPVSTTLDDAEGLDDGAEAAEWACGDEGAGGVVKRPQPLKLPTIKAAQRPHGPLPISRESRDGRIVVGSFVGLGHFGVHCLVDHVFGAATR